uniref:Protein zwilch n=1 Tax=Dicentrarchus labrax TaxID=13489 RepID=A0A8C4E3H7_DICLA
MFLCDFYKVPKINEPDDQKMTETSNCADDDDNDEEDANEVQIELGPQPLTIMKARQLLSWYTLSQNANVSAVDNNPVLHPLWVRCDMSDPSGTTWFGAETVCMGNKVSGVKLYSVTCKGSTVDKKSLVTLGDLKQEHKKRHHPSSVSECSARFNLFGSTVVENTTIESQSSVTVDFKWSHVESILETPPLSSTATLNIKVASGDMRSPMFEMYRELEFLQTLADGLRTGETEWMEPLESTSAVTLTKALLEELQSTAKTLQEQAAKPSETETQIFNSLMERGDLDFVEQLWVRMRKSVTSYQDIGDCLKLVTEALRYGDIKPWIHRDSSSSLSKLILQSYHQQIDHVSLTGVTPVHMLLEMGVDKMRKDYINYLIGLRLFYLCYLLIYLCYTEVDLQEQVIRLRKLHHLLEIILTCSTFLGLPYDRLFLLTQSCLQHYKTYPYDEEHDFKLQIKPALISHFYQKEHPAVWGVEVSSGHGPREVRTSLQLSDRPLVDHVIFETDYQNETVNGDSEDPAFFSTMVYCSLVSFVSMYTGQN